MAGRLTRPVVWLLATVCLLAGCVTPGAQPDSDGDPTALTSTMTLDEAKAITLERQDEIAALFPADHVGEVIRPETSRALYGCGEGDWFQWPGVTRIVIVGEVDRASIIEEIGAYLEQTESWTVERDTSSNGFPSLRLVNDDGSRFRVGFYEGGAEFWVDAASPCFHLEGGLVPGTEY